MKSLQRAAIVGSLLYKIYHCHLDPFRMVWKRLQEDWVTLGHARRKSTAVLRA